MKGVEYPREPVAILGMSCRLPGAPNPDALWTLVSKQRESVADYPRGRSPEMDAFYARLGSPDGPVSLRGGFLPGIDLFDAAFFEISPREAEWLDPQQRLLLEVGWEALEDAGLSLTSVEHGGVFAGVWVNEYERNALEHAPAVDFFGITGGPLYGASSRLCWQFGMRGPDASVNAACASSLVAVHLAVRALRAKECSVALAGGANVLVRPEITQGYTRAGMLSSDGRCKFGDASADGFVRSEGVGMLVLRRLSDAIRDGDRILAVIRGTSVTNNGRSSGFLATPGSSGQQRAMREALADAGVDPATIDLVEAHGTGTRAGDPVEVAAMGAVFGRAEGRTQPCRTASLKTNIGHTESAAGVASIIRAVQALRHRRFPASLHVRKLNPQIDWEGERILLEQTGSEWPQPEGRPRRAGINGLGLTGTNAHVILEEAAPDEAAWESNSGASAVLGAEPAYLLPLSAANDTALRQRASDISAVLSDLQQQENAAWDLCYTTAVRRTHLSHRVAVAGTNAAELRERLQAFAQGEQPPFVASGTAASSRKVAFVFPGQGSQWAGMGRELLRTSPVFRQAMEPVDAAIAREAGWSVLQQLEDPSLEERLARIDVVQPTLFAMEAALAELWKSWGIQADAVVGHSMGEVAAAYSAGILSLDDAARIICRRSALLMRVAGAGAMVVVDLAREEAQQAIAGAEDKVSVAVCNSPRSTVLAGDPAALDRIVETLEKREIFCRRVRVDVASHSPQMDVLKADLSAATADIQPHAGSIPLCSTVRAGMLEGSSMDGGYWVENLRRPVLFADSLGALLRQGFDTFVEMSPHPILLPFVEQTTEEAGTTAVAVGSLRREEPETATLCAFLGQLFAAGADINWNALYPSGQLLSLPAYPWQRERFWIEGPGRRRNAGGHPLLGELLETATGERVWNATLTTDSFPWLRDHGVRGTLLFPASAWIEMAGAAVEALFGRSGAVEQFSLNEALVIRPGKRIELQTLAAADTDQTFRLRFYSRGSETTPWQQNAECRVQRRTLEAGLIGDPGAWEAAEFAPDVISGGEHARQMTALGYDFGPAFTCVEWIRTANGEALGQLRAMEREAAWRLHPAIFDGALQILAHLLLHRDTSGQLLLPVTVDRVEWHARAEGDRLLVRATTAEPKLRGNVEIFDSVGRRVITLRGVAFRPLDGDADLSRFLYATAWNNLPPECGEPQAPGDWLLIAEDTSIAGEIAGALQQRGASVVLRSPQDVFSGTSAGLPASVAWLSCLHLGPSSALRETQRIFAQGAALAWYLAEMGVERFSLVTRASQPAADEPVENVMGAGAWGLFASIANEMPGMEVSCIDLPAAPLANEAEQIAGIFLRRAGQKRIALRNGGSYYAELVAHESADIGENTIRAEELRSDQSFELVQRTPGSVDSLHIRTAPATAPNPDEVEIDVQAAGLNFRDVLRAMSASDELASPHFGGECAGVIRRVGHEVRHFRPGNEVFAISPSFSDAGMLASRVRVPECLVQPKPETISAVQAAGIPCVFLTAWYGLAKLARLQKGEKVLIHAAAGGVGMAALQVARWIGAEIWATAGSEEKRAMLRQLGIQHVMNSRTLDFSRQILEETEGQGVDVVLNSLAGPAIPAGLDTLAPYGRFIEIGRRDIWEDSHIGLSPFRKNLSFFAVDLAQAVQDRRAMVAAMFQEIVGRFAAGDFTSLPTKVFPIACASEAFEWMARGAHIGKVVLEIGASATRVRRDASILRPDAAYLITGGLGGVSLEIAEALVRNGAKHLILTSRSSPSAEARRKMAALERLGARVFSRQADVSNDSQLQALLAEIHSGNSPLRGIVHAAGILDDAVAEHLTEEKFARVMAAKVSGALALDAAVQPGTLDFLVYTSSVAGVLGTPGQGNYAAANAILDALAHRQRARGIPAMAIDWGTWGEVGLAAAKENRGARMEAQGLTPLPPRTGQAIFLRALADLPVQVSAMNFAADSWCGAFPAAAHSGLLQKLCRRNTPVSQGTSGFLENWASLPAEELRSALLGLLRHEVASVLRLDFARIPVDKPLRSLGLDSLMALELRNRLERQLHLRLSATIIWNYPTAAALADYLQSRLGADLPAELRNRTGNEVSAPSGTYGNSTPKENGSADAETLSAAEMLEAELMDAESLLSSRE